MIINSTKLITIVIMTLQISLKANESSYLNQNIAVLEIQSTTLTPQEKSALSQKLRSDIFAHCNCSIIENSHIGEKPKQQNTKEKYSDDSVTKIGQKKTIMVTVIEKIDQMYSASTKLINSETGAILHHSSLELNCSKEVLFAKGIRELVGFIWNDSSCTSAMSAASGFLKAIINKDSLKILSYIKGSDRSGFEKQLKDSDFPVINNPKLNITFGQDLSNAEVNVIGTEIGFDLEYLNGCWWITK